jgi:hypothetical protein
MVTVDSRITPKKLRSVKVVVARSPIRVAQTSAWRSWP